MVKRIRIVMKIRIIRRIGIRGDLPPDQVDRRGAAGEEGGAHYCH